MTELDEIVRSSLAKFAAEALDGSWNGRREREAISLYVLGYLLQLVSDSGFLRSPTQIGIEFPVPQLDDNGRRAISGSSGSKRQVCKDVVIWPQPRMTCWDSVGKPTVVPSAILEWKFDASSVSERDVKWLRQYSLIHRDFIGYAVTANQPGADFRLICTRVSGGSTEPGWLHVP